MAKFAIYNAAGQGMNMDHAFFGLSYTGQSFTYEYTADEPSNDSSWAIYSVNNNPVGDRIGIVYKDLGPSYTYPYDLQEVVIERSGNSVFWGYELNLESTQATPWSFDVGYDVIMAQDDTFWGNDFADTIYGWYGKDTLWGNGGNDFLGGGDGNDYLDGGSGTDTAWYYGRLSDFLITRFSNGGYTVKDLSGSHGIDTLFNIEKAEFEFGGAFTLNTIIDDSVGDAGNNALTGNGFWNTIWGQSGKDILKGVGGNDTLIGGAGNDVVYGGLGNDTLWGEAGKDFFVFDTKPHSSTNRDVIKDFRVVDDTIRLDNAVFTKVGLNGALSAGAFWSNNTGKAHDVSDRIIYDKDSGVLYYDADGTGNGAAVQFATIAKYLALTSKDLLII